MSRPLFLHYPYSLQAEGLHRTSAAVGSPHTSYYFYLTKFQNTRRDLTLDSCGSWKVRCCENFEGEYLSDVIMLASNPLLVQIQTSFGISHR